MIINYYNYYNYYNYNDLLILRLESLPTLRRKYKFWAESGEGGAHAPKEGRRKTINKRYNIRQSTL